MTETDPGPEAVLRAMLEAGARGDAEAIDRLLAPDLLLYKVGRIRRREHLLAAVHDFTARGGEARYTLSDMVVRQDGALATLSFRSRGEFRMPGEPPRVAHWLESVTLVRTDRWRIAFYHSTDEVEDQ